MKKFDPPDFEALDNILIEGLCKVRLDDDFTLLAANENFYNMYGYTPQEMQIELGNRLIAVIADRDVNKIKEITTSAFESGKSSFCFEKHIRRRDGKEALLFTKGLFVVENNEVVMYANVEDLTSECEMRQRLNLDEQKLAITRAQTNNLLSEYDIKDHALILEHHASEMFALPERIENVPESLIERGIIHPDNASAYRTMFERVNQGEAMASCIARIKIFDGSYIWYRHTLNMIYDMQGNALEAVAVLEDITSQKEAEISYIKEEHYRQAMLSGALYWVQVNLETDTIEKFVDHKNIFPVAWKKKNYSVFIRDTAAKRVHIEDREKFWETFKPEALKIAFENGQKEVSCENRRVDEDGNFKWHDSTAYLLKDPLSKELKGLLCLKNIDEKKRQELKLQFQSQMDPLTGLYNKKMTEELINHFLGEQVLKKSTHAFLILDVDDFKNVNDRYGHLHGDHVLSKMAAVIRGSFRERDIIGRIGGDEFVIFMKNIVDVQAAVNSAEKVCRIFREHFPGDEKISCSIGMAFYPMDGGNYEELYRKSDIALYKAKREGKNQSRVYEEKEDRCTWIPTNLTQIDSHEEELSVDICEEDFLLADLINDPVYLSSPDTYELLYMNLYLCRQLDYTKEQYRGQKCYKVLQGRDKPCPFCTNGILSYDKPYTWERKHQQINKTFLLRDYFVHYKGQKVRLEYGMDITEKNRISGKLEHQLKSGNVLLECVRKMIEVSQLKDALKVMLETLMKIYSTDRAYIFEYRDKRGSIKNFLEVCSEEAVPRSALEMDPNMFNSTFWMEHLREKGVFYIDDVESLRLPYTDEYKNMWKYKVERFYAVPIALQGEIKGFLVLENPALPSVDSSFLESIVYFTVNIIANKTLTEKFKYMSYHDELTGLLNRNAYMKRLESLKKQELKTAGVLVININGLKELNESYGHLKGDEAVREHARTFARFFTEDHVFRLSGDEFVVVWPECMKSAFEARTAEMEAAIDELDFYGASVGLVWSDDEPDIQELVSKADELMLAAKQQYYDQRHHKSRHIETKHLQNLLHEIREGHFQLYLQPKVDIKTGKIVSAEALSRYYTEKTGLVTPGKFIPILEKERIIRYLDLYIVEEVCRLLQRWRAQGKRLLPISLNISRITLLEDRLADTMRLILDKYGISSSMVDAEITETIGQMDQNTLVRIGDELKKAGFHVQLDDFGAKYSNTMLLALFQFDVLKLDKSLVNNLVDNEKNQVIVRHIFDMCRELGLSVVAEGVEDLNQRNLLEQLGCRYIQGYLFGKPVPVPSFEAQLEKD